MRKFILTLLALAVMVVSYESMALGAASPAGARGEISFMGAPHCDLRFAFSGLQPGAKGRLKVTAQGSVAIVIFHVPSSSGHLNFRLGQFVQMPEEGGVFSVHVQYGIAVQGMDHLVTGETTATCSCNPGGGGSGGGGNENGGGTPSAGAASAVSSTPGFAG
jgi:hypothetical protein